MRYSETNFYVMVSMLGEMIGFALTLFKISSIYFATGSVSQVL